MVAYIISYIIGVLSGIFGMGLFVASGRQDDYTDAYEQGRHDALKEIVINERR